MIYITTPNFLENYSFNEKLHFLLKDKSKNKWLYYTDIKLYNQNGSFPFHSWNGGYNNCFKGKTLTYRDLIHFSTFTLVPVNINCANILLQDTDLADIMAHQILKIYENGANNIEISDLKLYDFIKEKYPDYGFILSKEAYFLNPENYTLEVVNALIDSNKFKNIMIPEHLSKDLEFLNQIKNKSKISVAINSKCPNSCKNYDKCHYIEHDLQLSYSGHSQFQECDICFKNQLNNFITLDEIEKIYLPMGINHFYFTEFNASYQPDYLINFFVRFFIKPEYHLDAINYFKGLGEFKTHD